MKNVFGSKSLKFNDQFVDDVSLSKTLAKESIRPEVELYFDSVDLVDGESQETIVMNALDGSYTFKQLLRVLNEYHHLTTPH
jgi:hypothetical protein